MTDAPVIEGSCLCGGVCVKVPAPTPELRACHCEMCRKLTSGIYFSILTDQEGMEVTGSAKTYRSSDWAKRGFCGTCGAVLWYGTVTTVRGICRLACSKTPETVILRSSFMKTTGPMDTYCRGNIGN